MISLPDVNVLLALVAAGHTHHASAHGWFETQEPDSVGICRVTQMGLLRLLTNPKVLPSGVYPIGRALLRRSGRNVERLCQLSRFNLSRKQMFCCSNTFLATAWPLRTP